MGCCSRIRVLLHGFGLNSKSLLNSENVVNTLNPVIIKFFANFGIFIALEPESLVFNFLALFLLHHHVVKDFHLLNKVALNISALALRHIFDGILLSLQDFYLLLAIIDFGLQGTDFIFNTFAGRLKAEWQFSVRSLGGSNLEGGSHLLVAPHQHVLTSSAHNGRVC